MEVDLQHVVSDDQVRAELVDRAAELAASAPATGGALEGLDALGQLTAKSVAEGVGLMNEGAWGDPEHPAVLEAIVNRFARPVLLVQDSTFKPAVDGFPESQVVTTLLTGARQRLDTAIASVGRVNLANHRFDWVGTGWVVAPQIVVTNRHVAEYFAAAKGGSFALRLASNGKTVKPSIDWRGEYQRPAESIVGVDEVLWVNPDEKPDIALLHIGAVDGDGTASPKPIPLMTTDEIKATVGNWAAVIGYPARSPYNNLADQQRIFDGIYDVKRLAPGTIMAVSPDGLFRHDATTLGGNSGSVVVDLASGMAIGLHFGGIEGDRNEAVQAPVLADLVKAHG
jgi:endonuclease G